MIILTTEKILQEVKDYIIKKILIGVINGDLNPDDSLLQQGILNSTGVVDLVSFLEGRYKIAFQDDEITPENLDSLNSIAAFLMSKLAIQSTAVGASS
jgi:acyl carrier protein